jgi:hypothetical protein
VSSSASSDLGESAHHGDCQVSLLNDLSGVLRTNARFLRRTQPQHEQVSAAAVVSASTLAFSIATQRGADETPGAACSSPALANLPDQLLAITRVPLQLV